MKLHILNDRNGYQKTMHPDEAKYLIWNEYCPDSQKILRQLKEKNYRIRCQCQVIMHTVFNPDTQTYFLRRNPSQDRRHRRECGFWAPTIPKGVVVGTTRDIPRGSTDKLLLNLQIEEKTSCTLPTAKKTANQTPPETRSFKYKSMFAFLYTMFDRLGIHCYPNPVLKRKADWEDIHDFLQSTPYRDFFWCPSSRCPGGSVALNKKILMNWTNSKRVGQGLLLGIVDQIPEDGRLVIKKWVRDKFPIKCRVANQRIAVIGDTGPYFALAVCTANTKDDPEFATPQINRMILQAVKSWASWIPVEIDEHRKMIGLFFQKKLPFKRPLFAQGLNLDIKPDFVVQDVFVVDSQMGSKGQDEEKRHRLKQFYKLPIINYDVGCGDEFFKFKRRLMTGWRQNVSRADAC